MSALVANKVRIDAMLRAAAVLPPYGFTWYWEGKQHVLGTNADAVGKMLLDENVRATDVAARLGGDEFAVILQHTTPRGGRRRVAMLEQLINGATVDFEAAEIPVRASFGTIAFGADDEATNLIARADAEMYRKKRAKPLVLRPWLHRAS